MATRSGDSSTAAAAATPTAAASLELAQLLLRVEKAEVMPLVVVVAKVTSGTPVITPDENEDDLLSLPTWYSENPG